LLNDRLSTKDNLIRRGVHNLELPLCV